MTTDEKSFIQGFFNTQQRAVWNDSPWLDISPYGEARFAGNLLTYPNDLTKTAYWTATAVTPTTSTTNPQFGNPCDNRKTATLLSETVANSAHSISQTYTFLPSINYQYSAYIRASGRNYVQFSVYDGNTTYTAFFNVSTGVIGSSANVTTTPTIIQSTNGYWLCTLYFTSSASATAGTVTTKISTDGSTTSYAGDITKGVYSWGNLLLQNSFASPNLLVIPWEQTGEEPIDAVISVWRDNPANTNFPRPQGYELTTDGIQIVGSGGYAYGVYFNAVPNGYTPAQFPVYLYYRKQPPNYTASDWSATLTYSVDDQVLFEVTGNGGNVTNFYKCVVATTAGQSPSTAPTSWEKINIYEVFFNTVLYGAYADWLRMDGQMEKALAMDSMSQKYKDDESDRQERLMGWVQPCVFSSHVTSQPRV